MLLGSYSPIPVFIEEDSTQVEISDDSETWGWTMENVFEQNIQSPKRHVSKCGITPLLDLRPVLP